jgi:hypothetical protein
VTCANGAPKCEGQDRCDVQTKHNKGSMRCSDASPYRYLVACTQDAAMMWFGSDV